MKLLMMLIALLLMIESPLYAKSYKTKKYKHKHALGLKRDKEKHKRFLKGAVRGEVADVPVPANMDLSPLVSPPENQGNCGSCWAFGITKSLRSAWMLVGKDPGTLAFNYLVNNCGGVANEWGCNGGDFDAGQNFLNGKGPWLESQDPYKQTDNGRCLGLAPAATGLTYKTVGNGVPAFKDLAQAISQKHMLVVDVAVCGEWGNYDTGIFDSNQCGANSINHIVNMNGYDCQTSVDSQGNCVFDSKGEPKNGDGFLIVMNNWGTQWGEKGYMRTRAHVDAIADTAMYFEVDYVPPPPVPPTPPPVPPTPPTPTPDNGNGMPFWVWILIGLVAGAGFVIVGYKLHKD